MNSGENVNQTAHTTRKLRFMQVHNLYPVYYTNLYGRLPHLANAPYSFQNAVLIDDGFAGIHMFAPYLGEHGYDSCLVFANCNPAQQRWATENGLPNVGKEGEQDILRYQIEKFDPDVLYLSDPISLDSHFVRSLRKRPQLVMGWRAADVPAYTDWSEFDVILSALPNLLDMAKRLGARSTELFSPGVPARFPKRFSDLARTTDVSFAGQMNATQYTRRNALLETLANAAANAHFSLDLHLIVPTGFEISSNIRAYKRPPAFGSDLYKALSRAKIAFDARGSIELQSLHSSRSKTAIDLAAKTTANMRIFEATACGALLLTQEQSNLNQYFEIGREIVTYRNESDMIEAITYFLQNDSERQTIAERGRVRCLRDHSMEAKARHLDKIIRHRLPIPRTEGSASDSNITPKSNDRRSKTPIFAGTLVEAIEKLRDRAKKYPRRKPGYLIIDNLRLHFADLHSFYHELTQIFAENIYGFTPGHREPIILDCGAHIGLATLYFGRRFPLSEIHAFEADPDIFKIFQTNIDSAGLRNVVSHSKAVWIHDKGVGFKRVGDDSGHIDQSETNPVQSISLKNYISNFNHVDLLKLDVEGAEYEIIQDCMPVLNRVQNIIIEIHHLSNSKPQLSKILRTLEDTGFQYTLSDLHAATWLEGDNSMPFDFIKNNKFIATVFAWRIQRKQVTNRQLDQKSIAQICIQDFGGAGTAALRLHSALLRAENNDVLYVQNIKKWNENTRLLSSTNQQNTSHKYISPAWNDFLEKNKAALEKYRNRPNGLEMFTIPWASTQLQTIPAFADIDIINLHWIPGTIDISQNIDFLKHKKIVWTLHDMNPFTGGCHYAGSCKKFESQCGSCPQLGSDQEHDLSREIWEQKMAAYSQLDITIVALCQWMADCVKKSSLLSSFPIHIIPNGVPTEIFKPYSQSQIRQALKIPQEAFVILFGADSVTNARKGFKYLISALNYLKKVAPSEQLAVITFGHNAQNVAKTSGYQTFSFDYIDKESDLARIYNAADATVIPSLEDNLPNIVLESMACGTPVVGFETGGIPDMVEHQVNGYLAPIGNHEELAKGILWVSDQKKNQSTLKIKCRETILLKFNSPLQAKSYLKLYEEIIDGKKLQTNHKK